MHYEESEDDNDATFENSPSSMVMKSRNKPVAEKSRVNVEKMKASTRAGGLSSREAELTRENERLKVVIDYLMERVEKQKRSHE